MALGHRLERYVPAAGPRGEAAQPGSQRSCPVPLCPSALCRHTGARPGKRGESLGQGQSRSPCRNTAC